MYYFVLLYPAFAAFYAESIWQIVRRDVTISSGYLIALPAGCLALLIYANAREERYLLPAYPMIAVIAAAGIFRLMHFIESTRMAKWPKRTLIGLVTSCLVALTFRAALQGVTLVFNNGVIFPVR